MALTRSVAATAVAQDSGAWSESNSIVEAATGELVTDPRIAADLSGQLHVFWLSQLVDSSGAVLEQLIYYARWSQGGWTAPVDIAAASSGSLGLLEATADGTGSVHVLWRDGPCLYHSEFPVVADLSARSWRAGTECVAERGFDGDIAIDRDGRLHFAYNSDADGAVYYVSRPDGVSEALSPRKVASPTQAGRYDKWVRLAIDTRGRIHVVWTETEGGWPPTGIWYSGSNDGGVTWTEPWQIDDGRIAYVADAGSYDQVNVVVDSHDFVHMLWNGTAGVGGRYHLWSGDGGVSWSRLIEIVPRGGRAGTSGFPEVAFDSAGTMHLITDDGFIAHVRWDGVRWSSPEIVSAGQHDYTEQPQIAITGGNMLHAVYFEGRKSIEHAALKIDAPYLTPRAAEVMTPKPRASPVPSPAGAATEMPSGRVARAMATSEADRDFGELGLYGQSHYGRAVPLLSGLMLAIVVVAMVLLAGRFRR